MKETDESGSKQRAQLEGSDSHSQPLFNSIHQSNFDSRTFGEEKDVEKSESTRISASPSTGHETTAFTWEKNDPENPYNWSTTKKTWILFTLMMTITNSCLGSSLTSNGIRFIVEEFGIDSRPQRALPISLYLIGYVLGPLVWAPTSEQLGRRDITIGTFILFALFTMACALAPNWPALLIFRLFTGVFASAPIAVVTGVLADIYQDHRTRGRAVVVYMVITAFGPLLAPILSGFVSPTIGWRWSFWIAMVFAGVTLVPLATLPETYAPVLLARRVARIRKSNAKASGLPQVEKRGFGESVTALLTRPLHMLIFEPIVSASSAYLAVCYTIFYMSFQAFPIIFQELYGLSPGACGLTYLTIGAGCVISLPVFWLYDDILVRAQQSQKPWVSREEYRRLPMACLGGPLFAISLFWLGWSAREDISFTVPMIAGIPFGFGFICIFTALLNYLTDAYEIYAASANAASSCSRSMLATVLPLATAPMFERLGIAGACSLFGGLTALLCVIPFIFIWQGERIRTSSKFCSMLKNRKEDAAAKLSAQDRAEPLSSEG